MGAQSEARDAAQLQGKGRLALVTGGAGFIGAHLVDRLLAANWRVRVLDNLSIGRPENVAPDAELIMGDITDPAACQRACHGADTIFHLAANVTIRGSIQAFHHDANVNILGTLALLQAASAAKVRRFVLTSSMAVYADPLQPVPLDESSPARPETPYGISKLAAEHYTLLLAPQAGIEPVVLRLFNTFGTRQTYTPYVGVVTIFIRNGLAETPSVILGDGFQCRDFVGVQDVAAALALAADAPRAAGQVINIGSGTGTTVNQVVEMLRERMPTARFQHVDSVPGEPRHSVANIQKAMDILGYRPCRSLSGEFDHMIQWWSDNLARAGSNKTPTA